MGNEKTVSIPNISCSHCAAAIRRNLSEVRGVQDVAVDVDEKRATYRWESPATWQDIVRVLEEIGYPPAK